MASILKVYERTTQIIFILALLMLASVIIIELVRTQDATATNETQLQPHEPGNYPLYIYYSRSEMFFRDTTDFEEQPAEAAGTLQQGDLFYYDERSVYQKTYKHSAWPRDSEENYSYARINVLQSGAVRRHQVAAYSMQQQINGQTVATHDYLPVRSLRITDWIVWRLQQEPEPENLIKIDGYYGIRINGMADCYDSSGDFIGFIRRGWVFSTPAVPFATGERNPELMRVVGWSLSPEPYSVEVKSLEFIDIFDENGRMTFELS